MEEKILSLAMTLGKCSDSEETILTPLCVQASLQLTGRLRSGLCPEDCEEAFVLAGAWTALAHYALSNEKVEQFSAGDVTVHHRDAKEQGSALLLQAEQILRPYVQDEGFCFQGV